MPNTLMAGRHCCWDQLDKLSKGLCNFPLAPVSLHDPRCIEPRGKHFSLRQQLQWGDPTHGNPTSEGHLNRRWSSRPARNFRPERRNPQSLKGRLTRSSLHALRCRSRFHGLPSGRDELNTTRRSTERLQNQSNQLQAKGSRLLSFGFCCPRTCRNI